MQSTCRCLYIRSVSNKTISFIK